MFTSCHPGSACACPPTSKMARRTRCLPAKCPPASARGATHSTCVTPAAASANGSVVLHALQCAALPPPAGSNHPAHRSARSDTLDTSPVPVRGEVVMSALPVEFAADPAWPWSLPRLGLPALAAVAVAL